MNFLMEAFCIRVEMARQGVEIRLFSLSPTEHDFDTNKDCPMIESMNVFKFCLILTLRDNCEVFEIINDNNSTFW